MFSSLKDRLNSAVNSGIAPKSEDGKSVTPEGDSLLEAKENSETRNSTEIKENEEGEKKEGSAPSSNGSKHKAEVKSNVQNHPLAGNGAFNNNLSEQNKETPVDNTNVQEQPMSDDLAKKLEKLKKYEVKYPELARAYKFQVAKLKSLDVVLQTMTPVQSYSDVEGLEEYLKNLASQNEMAMSEFKRVSSLNNDSNQQLQASQKELEKAQAKIVELEASKIDDTSTQFNHESDLSQVPVNLLVKELCRKINDQSDGSSHDSYQAELSELVALSKKILGNDDESEEKLKVKEMQTNLDAISSEFDNLKQEHQLKSEQLISSENRVKGLQDFESQVVNLNKKIEEVTLNYNEINNTFKDLSGINKSCDSHKENLKDISTYLNKLSSEKEKLEKKADVLNNIVLSLRTSIEEKTSQISNLSEELAVLKSTEVNKNGVNVATPSVSTNDKPESKNQRKKKKNKGPITQPQVSPQPVTPTPSSPSGSTPSHALELQLETSNTECLKLEQVIKDQKSELHLINETLQLANNDLEISKEKIVSLQDDLEKALLSEKNTRSALNELRSQLDKQVKCFEAQSSELSKLKKTCEDLSISKKEATEELATLKKEEAKLKAALDKQNSELKELKDKVKHAETNSVLQEEITKLESQSQDLNKRLEDSIKESTQRQVTVNRLNKRVNELESDIKAKDAALNFSKRQNVQLGHEKNDMEGELLSQQRQIKALNTLIKKKDDDINNHNSELLKIKEDNEKQQSLIADLNSSNEKLENEIKEINNTLSDKVKIVDELKSENERLHKQTEDAIQERNLAQTELKNQVDELETLRNDIKAIKERSEVLNQDLATSKKLFKEKACGLDALHLQYAKLQETSSEELTQLKEELTVSKNRISELQNDLTSVRASTEIEISSLNSQLEKNIEELKKYKESLDQTEVLNKSLTEDKNRLSEREKELTSKIDPLESELKELSGKLELLSTIEDELNSIKVERDTLSEQSKLRESHLKNLNRDLKEEVKRLQRANNGVNFGNSPPMSPTEARSISDIPENDDSLPFNMEYLRNVIIKFLSDRDRRPQLVTVLTHLLKFSSSDARKLMDVI